MRKKKNGAMCHFEKPNGEKCEANAGAGSRFCFFHDPAQAEKRREAQSTGGSRKHATTLPRETPDCQLRTVQDVVELLAGTINQLRRGQLDPRVSNGVGFLASILLKALESGELEGRIELLEAAVKMSSSAVSPLDEEEQIEFVEDSRRDT